MLTVIHGPPIFTHISRPGGNAAQTEPTQDNSLSPHTVRNKGPSTMSHLFPLRRPWHLRRGQRLPQSNSLGACGLSCGVPGVYHNLRDPVRGCEQQLSGAWHILRCPWRLRLGQRLRLSVCLCLCLCRPIKSVCSFCSDLLWSNFCLPNGSAVVG